MHGFHFRATISRLPVGWNDRGLHDAFAVGRTSNAIELAFQACQSDERAIVERLSAVGMAPATAEKALRAFKLRLQKSVR
jgi:hypothetical protein